MEKVPSIEPILSEKYTVTAYIHRHGYGDNRSKDFTNKDDAIAYAKSLPKEFKPSILRIIKMKEIHIKIDF